MIFDRSDQDQFGICFGCCTDPEPIEFGPGLRCQGRSKTRPVGRSKSRPVAGWEVIGYAGSVVSGA
jgi:hypothetical protein